ncbi:MAG: response regulator, partial [Nitrospinota bacterium]|nr:response regulator [Nitrospinota bacterium]
TTLVVEDSGVGMSQAQMDSLYKSGGKNSTPGTAGERGTGLGLSYTMEILKAHGGDIYAESEQGKGCRFYLTLPEVKPLVLLADDEPAVRTLLRTFLCGQGFEVVEADGGAAALDAMESHSPHLVLLDLLMPGVDGFTVIKRIRANRKNLRLPILVMTADDSAESKEQALRLGADDFLSKPVSLENMLIRVNNLILRSGAS